MMGNNPKSAISNGEKPKDGSAAGYGRGKGSSRRFSRLPMILNGGIYAKDRTDSLGRIDSSILHSRRSPQDTSLAKLT